MTTQTWFARLAWVGNAVAHDVVIEADGGRFTRVAVDASTSSRQGADLLPGLVMPGLANVHSHAFHRALRGRTQTAGGTFWTWRERMYAVAARLDPDSYLALARAVYAEMALAGITAVGEFHYLHHKPDGGRYDDPNAMGVALRQAASDAGVRLTLLDVCYLSGGLTPSGHRPLSAAQVRFGDRDVDAWAERIAARQGDTSTVLGVAAHSVRGTPSAALDVVAAQPGPRHVHVSEQPAENEACRAFYGCSPTDLLDAHGFLGPGTTAVHATHLTPDDITRLGSTHTTVCLCPTTEQDLADGLGPARALADAGTPLALGSDQHAVVDLLREGRGLEMHERLATGDRGRFRPDELIQAMTNHGCLGVADAGRLEVGARADLVAVRLDTPATAGVDPAQIVLVATAADVDTVVVDGRTVVSGGRHRLGDVAALLRDAIAPLWA